MYYNIKKFILLLFKTDNKNKYFSTQRYSYLMKLGKPGLIIFSQMQRVKLSMSFY